MSAEIISKKQKKLRKQKQKQKGSVNNLPSEMKRIKEKVEEYESIVLDEEIFINYKEALSNISKQGAVIQTKSKSAKQIFASVDERLRFKVKEEGLLKPNSLLVCLVGVDEHISKLISGVEIAKRQTKSLLCEHKLRLDESYRLYEDQSQRIVCICKLHMKSDL